MRRSLFSFLAVALALVQMWPAAAQSPAEVAEIVSVQGYYVEPGSEPVSESGLRDLADTMQQRGFNFIPVVLAADPSGGPTHSQPRSSISSQLAQRWLC